MHVYIWRCEHAMFCLPHLDFHTAPEFRRVDVPENSTNQFTYKGRPLFRVATEKVIIKITLGLL